MDEPQVYTIDEVSGILRVCEALCRRLVKSGQLRAVKAGRRYLVPVSAVKEFLEGGENGKKK